MDKKGTLVDMDNHIRLTSVRPGRTCRLVGISNTGGRGLGRYRHREHQEHASFLHRLRRPDEQHEHKKQWQHKGQRQVEKRLLDLGLTKGCTFKVVQGRGSGPVLVEVRGTRIALGYGLASKVLVEVLEGEE
ncbi:MAG: ferrous iron transport protein A [Candidatus Thorarchaeota archaeon]